MASTARPPCPPCFNPRSVVVNHGVYGDRGGASSHDQTITKIHDHRNATLPVGHGLNALRALRASTRVVWW